MLYPTLIAREQRLLRSETDPVNGLYVIFEMLQVFENEPLRLIY